MIATLFAQEFRATRRNLFMTVGPLLLVAVVSLTLFALNIPVIGPLGMGFGIVLIALVTPVVLGLLVENYWRTMYGRQGYFTMSLPVRGRTLFAAKVLYGFVAGALALIVTVLALLGAAVALAVSQGQEPFAVLRAGLDTMQPWQLWLGIVGALLQLTFFVVVGAGIMSVAAEARFNHLGFGAPVIGGVLTYLVMQVVTFAAIMFVPIGLVLTGPDAGAIVPQGMFDEIVSAIKRSGAPAASAGTDVSVLGLGFLFTSLAAIIVMAWWGSRSVERRTSLR